MRRLGFILVRMKLLTGEDLTEALSTQLKLPIVKTALCPSRSRATTWRGRGLYANGYYGVRFENARLWSSFVKAAQRQFSAEQIEWMDWVLREKLKETAQPLIAKNG